MSGPSLGADYFDGIFASDDDPWSLASSAYERAKFAHTRDVLADRRYLNALEVGCAHGVLTERIVDLCEQLLSVDISRHALVKARTRLGGRPGFKLKRMAFPQEAPTGAYDLVLLSEVAYYWDDADLMRAGKWLSGHLTPNGRIMLVHYTGDTDYPHTADAAVGILWNSLRSVCTVQLRERHDDYRLDLWERQ